MYLYLYDQFLNSKRYGSLLPRIETRLTDLGIGGKIFRLSPLRNINEIIADEVRSGVKTVVAVGNDKTVATVINACAKLDITFGIIPVGSENSIASALGITSATEACNILSSRVIEKLDLGKVNETYFISHVLITSGRISIECEDKYNIIPAKGFEISICNLRPESAANFSGKKYFNPQDGNLEIFVSPIAKKSWSFFQRNRSLQESIIPFKKIEIRSKDSISVITEGQRIIKPPVQIEVDPVKFKVIVGRRRVF